VKVLICAPTLSGREGYLRNMMNGYRERSHGATIVFSTPKDLPSCGEGWNVAADVGLQSHPDVEFIHFSNDDVVPAQAWLPPLVQAAREAFLPCCRIEPVGWHLGFNPDPDQPVMAPAMPPAQTEHSYYYADLPENQPQVDWDACDHGALPFMSVEMWHLLRPFIPIHFGTDKWIFHRARQLLPAGPIGVARKWSVMFNYAAPIGRARGLWTENDFIDFDCNIAYPAYVKGDLGVGDRPSMRGTETGLMMVNDWRAKNL
jgi:hypothetical protein